MVTQQKYEMCSNWSDGERKIELGGESKVEVVRSLEVKKPRGLSQMEYQLNKSNSFSHTTPKISSEIIEV